MIRHFHPTQGDVVANLQGQIEELKTKTYIADETYSDYGILADSSLNAFLQNIITRFNLISSDTASFSLTLKLTNGQVLSGIYIDGITTASGAPIMSNSSGVINGFVGAGTKTLSLSKYCDLQPYSKTYTFGRGSSYTDTWTLTPNNYIRIDTSKSIMFSPRVNKISYSITGGGGGGGGGDAYHGSYSSYSVGGDGGNGGHSSVYTDISVTPNEQYPVAIGAGGNGGIKEGHGGAGGQTSFMGNTVSGGGGGIYPYLNGNHNSVGNGVGGYGAVANKYNEIYKNAKNGNVGSEKWYSSYLSLASSSGGGGGGGAVHNYDHITNGGTGIIYGGAGGWYEYITGTYHNFIYHEPTGGTFGGGGGGAAAYYNITITQNVWEKYANFRGAKGGSGVVAICIL